MRPDRIFYRLVSISPCLSQGLALPASPTAVRSIRRPQRTLTPLGLRSRLSPDPSNAKALNVQLTENAPTPTPTPTPTSAPTPTPTPPMVGGISTAGLSPNDIAVLGALNGDGTPGHTLLTLIGTLTPG